jgi:octaheme c-type cytochrome (tetrathionate reductase family)
MSSHPEAAPVDNKLFSPGVLVLLALMAVGFFFAAARFLFGLGTVTNLNNQYPWGIWIGIDVASGVALAAGSFTICALSYVFHRDHYKAVVRPALLTAMFGYTFVVLALLVDIGRYWNIWSPMIHWNGDSVLFEVGMCVMFYLTVLYIEFIPIVVERFKGRVRLPDPLARLNDILEGLLSLADRILPRVMPVFIIAGIVLSCLHQSSLGSLMLIAPYKVHPLWFTPILPLLFLLSAIAVGYPMIVLESLIAAKSLKREPEMEVLSGLAKFMAILIGIYLAVKIGDMLVRGTYTYVFTGTFQANAFLVEMLFGVMLPFVLLCFRKVRRSGGWLFSAAALYVGGVLLNRINVFIISFTPFYRIKAYFPAIGEIAITVAMVAGLIFLYRVCVTVFPVLGVQGKRISSGPIILIIATSLLLYSLIGSNAGAAEEAVKRPIPAAKKAIPSIDDAPKVHLLDSPVVNKYSDLYGPVRFMHSKHANVVKDCTICHHRIPREEGDRYGEPATMSELIRRSIKPKKCQSCHDHPFDPKMLHKPGLKGSYHRLCLDCHKESEQKTEKWLVDYRAAVKGLAGSRSLVDRAPTDCISCHAKNGTDHRDLVKLQGKVDALDITKACLSCHEVQGREMLNTAHWNWQGSSPYTVGHEGRVDLGKRYQAINNSCIALSGNWPRCTSCHAGYGWRDEGFDFHDMGTIDCLVCHDTTGVYHKSASGAGFPESGIDLLKVAQGVGRPSRATCGMNCHFSGGTFDPISHGSMNAELLVPTRNLDVHMGVDGMDFRCVECHKTRSHKISGRGVSVPVVEGYLSCQTCHTDKPHIGSGLLTRHLNIHTDHLACQTCHIPVYAKGKAAITNWDWSTAGKEKINLEAREGMNTHVKELGTLAFRETAEPTFLWYDGTVRRYLAGDRITDAGVTELNKPEGNRQDPDSRIYPFKVIVGKQISDAVYKSLITPKLWQGFWQHWDWHKAATEGMRAAGLAYSGTYEFVETVAYQGLNHEVLPKERALSCAQCHAALAKEDSCARCHQSRPDIDFKALAHKGMDFVKLVKEGHDATRLIGKTDYIDFKALGYAGDPIEVGGRFEKLPLKAGVQGDQEGSPSLLPKRDVGSGNRLP